MAYVTLQSECLHQSQICLAHAVLVASTTQVYLSLNGENYWYLQPGCVFLLLELMVYLAVKQSILWGNTNELSSSVHSAHSFTQQIYQGQGM